MNKRILFLFLVFCSTNVYSQLIWMEDFDGSNTSAPVYLNDGLSPSNMPCNVFGESYFGVMCDFGAGCGNQGEISATVSSTYAAGIFQGNFIGALDTDNSSGCGFPNSGEFELVEWFDIDISSCPAGASLYLCLDIATGTDGPGEGWDNVSSVSFGSRIDEPFSLSSFSLLAVLRNQGFSNTLAGFDLNCNGVGDDVLLTNSFRNYCFPINGSGGNNLDIQIKIEALNGSGEDIAIDNVAVWCGAPPTTPLSSCGTCSADADCDGVLQFEDCDDNDNFVTATLPATCAVSLSTCDNGTGVGTYDLTSLESTACFAGMNVEWFIEPSGSLNVINPSSYTPTNSFITFVYARLTGPNAFGCSSDIFSVELIVDNNSGCTNPNATNYNPTAICDDGSCIICPNTLVFVNPTDNFFSNDVNHFKARININANNVINSGSDIIYDAGQYIDLLPGFHVVQGAEFDAIIGGCQ